MRGSHRHINLILQIPTPSSKDENQNVQIPPRHPRQRIMKFACCACLLGELSYLKRKNLEHPCVHLKMKSALLTWQYSDASSLRYKIDCSFQVKVLQALRFR